MPDNFDADGALYIARLRESRSKAAVLKMRVATLRASYPTAIVLVFEGDDDKIVYAQWLRRVRPSLCYEPMPCRGKDQVLKLKESLLKDRDNLISGVYFFVDRDFDDLSGHASHDQLFMTDKYSVENYIVHRGVVESLLTNEFHCHANPGLRERITEEFEMLYAEFVRITRELNFRIYLHRARGVDVDAAAMPKKINQLAIVKSDSVSPLPAAPESRLPVTFVIPKADLDRLETDFASLDGASRYRGKFALMFFRRWLDELVKEYMTLDGGRFGMIDRTSSVREREFVLSNFASLSVVPEALADFVNSMSEPKAA